MDRKSKISKLFSKTVLSIKRQISLAYTKHTENCWRYYLAFDYKNQGCESVKLTRNKLICKKRSKSLENFNKFLQFEENNKSKSNECLSNIYQLNLEFKDIYEIEYDCECDY